VIFGKEEMGLKVKKSPLKPKRGIFMRKDVVNYDLL